MREDHCEGVVATECQLSFKEMYLLNEHGNVTY